MKRIPLFSLAAIGIVAAGCGLAEEDVVLSPDANGEIVINMDEFSFGADRIEVTAGETVTFVIVNGGANEHEFMIGRNLLKSPAGFPDGFEHDFFEDVTPSVVPANAGMNMGAMEGMDMGDGDAMDMTDEEMGAMGDGDAMDMTDEEMGAMEGMDMGDGDAMDMTDEEMGAMGDAGEEAPHEGYMVLRRSGEVARLTVTVPEDAIGEWAVGCFQGRGAHWDAGMNTKLFVLAA